METKKVSRKKITFPKILGMVIIIWVAIVLIKPLFTYQPKPVKEGVMSDNIAVLADGDMVAESIGIEANPMAKAVPSRVMSESVVSPEVVSADNNLPEINNTKKRIIKNGNLALKVESTEKGVEEIKNVVQKFDGDVTNINISRRGKMGLGGNVVIKVPVDKFEDAFQAVKEIGDQVLSESVYADDVTEQYVDLQAQIKNKKAEEETFRKLLERSGKLEDVLKVTREVARVRGEIDRLEGRIKYMESQTDMATINVSLTEYEQIASGQDTWKPLRVAQKALHDLVIKSQGLINGLIYFVIVQLPLLIIISLVLYILYKIIVKIFKKFRK